MKKISYAGESFVTSDGVADALLRYVAALGANHTSASIEIPTYSALDELELVQLVVGPSSEILSRPDPSTARGETASPDDPERNAVARLDARTMALTVTRNVVYAQPQGSGGYDFEELESL
ncbi:hypothetical protein B7R54_12225 [Subtercola boreus]|uniref:Uncharacterized protein n=1 Tax=Subtercola boreus TaxID=120213 RepID=A0A3E0VKB1_9MICO|nr:hypothetical protein [Subtercola boreus]RFA09883.1 hypothetical protein B7R54_12225 [Subtercola boreus]TQL52986.1 hypothetical protein FB464_0477 [Subtercola boreus]